MRTYNLEDRTTYYSYGLVEGEPTFPLTNLRPNEIEESLTANSAAADLAGLMVNCQTHAVQLPNTYLVSHFARYGHSPEPDLAGFADELVPGLGNLVARA